MAHCGGCHRTFSGITHFDSHRNRYACVMPTGQKKLAFVRPGVYGMPLPAGGVHPLSAQNSKGGTR